VDPLRTRNAIFTTFKNDFSNAIYNFTEAIFRPGLGIEYNKVTTFEQLTSSPTFLLEHDPILLNSPYDVQKMLGSTKCLAATLLHFNVTICSTFGGFQQNSVRLLVCQSEVTLPIFTRHSHITHTSVNF
jgi:hypothetical protein